MSWVIVAMFLEEVRPQGLTLKERWRKTRCTDNELYSPACKGQLGYTSGGVERRRRYIAEGRAEATAPTLIAHKPSTDLDRQLRDAYSPRDGISRTHPAHMVDACQIWRTRHEPVVDRLVYVGVWVHGRHLPIHCLPTRGQTFWPSARIRHLRRSLCGGDHYVSIGKPRATPRYRRLSHDRLASDLCAAPVVQHQ